MVQGAHGARLMDESFAKFPGDYLDGHPPLQSGVAPLVHLTHAAGADWLDDLIRSQLEVRSHSVSQFYLPGDLDAILGISGAKQRLTTLA